MAKAKAKTRGDDDASQAQPSAASQGRSANKSYEKIQVAALVLFSEKGVDSTSIRDIGAKANVPTSLLYHYARSKHRLVYDLMADGMERYQSSAHDARALGRSAEQRLVGLITAHVIMHCRNRALAKVIDNGWRSLPKKDKEVMLEVRDRYSRLWDDVLAEGVADGVFQLPDARLARLAIVQMCSVSTWFSPGGELPTEAIVDHFVDLVLGTVRACRDGRPLTRADVREPDYETVLTIVEQHHRGVVFGKRR